MKGLRCDTCGRFDEGDSPVGWYFVVLICQDTETDDSTFASMFGGRERHAQERRQFCSVRCLGVFAELERVVPDAT